MGLSLVATFETGSVILSNLSNWEEDAGQYDRELELAEEGISICLQHNRLQCFYHLLFNKGVALAYLGKHEEAQKIILMAFSVMQAENKKEMITHCYAEVKRLFSYDFSESLQKLM